MNGFAKDTENSNINVENVEKTTDHTDKMDGEKRREVEVGVDATDEKKKESWRERRKKSRDVDIPDDGVPYDRGWAWMIVLAGFVNFVVAAGYNRGTYIFFVSFLEEFQAPVTETALLFGVKAATSSVVGLFIMNAVVGRFGVRKTVFVGGICISLSAILGSFATDITSLIISQAVFHGLGMAMLNMPATVLLGFYFRRRRSLANSITKCGVGMGAVTFPPIVTFLLERFGLRGALMLMGAISLNTLVAAMLMRPVSFYKKRKERLDEARSGRTLLSRASTADRAHVGEEEEKANVSHDAKANTDLADDKHENHQTREDKRNCARTDDKNHSHPDMRETLLQGREKEGTGEGCVVIIEQVVISPLFPSKQPQKQTTLFPLTYPLLTAADISKSAPSLNNANVNDFQRRRVSSFSDRKTVALCKGSSAASRSGHVLDALSHSNVVRYMSSPHLELDAPCMVSPADQDDTTSLSESQPPRTCLRKARHVAGKVVGVLDFRLFHSPMFRLLVVYFITSPMVLSVITYLPAMATERGLDEQQGALLLSVIGGLDFCCRLICGFVADLKIIKVSTMIAIAFTIMGIVCQLTRFMTTFPLLIGLAVAQGLLGGISGCMLPILIMEDIGLENTAKALGFNKLFSGAAMAAFHPFLGYIRDSTGSYDVAYNVIGALTLLSAALIFCLRFLPHTLPPVHDPHTPISEESSPLKSSKC